MTYVATGKNDNRTRERVSYHIVMQVLTLTIKHFKTVKDETVYISKRDGIAQLSRFSST